MGRQTRQAAAAKPAGRPRKATNPTIPVLFEKAHKKWRRADEEEEEEGQEVHADGAAEELAHGEEQLELDPGQDEQQQEEEEEEEQEQQDAPVRKRGRGGGKAGKKAARRTAGEELMQTWDGEELKALFATVPERNVNKKQQLAAQARLQMPRWRQELREGFSLCIYGAGSKRALLEHFAREHLRDGAVVVATGTHPKASARSVLLAAADALTQRSWRGASNADALAGMAAAPAGQRLYLLLHNIDGPGLRSTADQALLSQLAACPAVHLVASIDHVHAPLMWDKHTSATFNWAWHCMHTYAPYEAETRHLPSPLAGAGSQARARITPMAVLSNMVPRARAVFRVLAERQLEDNGGSGNGGSGGSDGGSAEGLSFPLLYRACRELFLVTHERALQGMLTEFRDHELIRQRQAQDGSVVMYVPLEAAVVRKILEDLDSLDQ